MRFYKIEGTLFRFTDCAFTNTAAAASYRHLSWLLIASTLFGWGNVAYEFWTFRHSASGLLMTCSAAPVPTPFQSPCFYGSTMFLGALVCVTWLLRAMRSAAT